LGSAARALSELVENGNAALYVPTHVLIGIGAAHAEGDISLTSCSSAGHRGCSRRCTRKPGSCCGRFRRGS